VGWIDARVSRDLTLGVSELRSSRLLERDRQAVTNVVVCTCVTRQASTDSYTRWLSVRCRCWRCNKERLAERKAARNKTIVMQEGMRRIKSGCPTENSRCWEACPAIPTWQTRGTRNATGMGRVALGSRLIGSFMYPIKHPL